MPGKSQLYLFSHSAVIDYCKFNDLRHHKYILQSQGSEVQVPCDWTNVFRAGCSWRLQGRRHLLAFASFWKQTVLLGWWSFSPSSKKCSIFQSHLSVTFSVSLFPPVFITSPSLSLTFLPCSCKILVIISSPQNHLLISRSAKFLLCFQVSKMRALPYADCCSAHHSNWDLRV